MKISDCYNIRGITANRQMLLSDTITTFGHETPQTLEIFAVSERLPEEEWDDPILALYKHRLNELLDAEDEEEFFEEPDEYDYEMGFNPYLGCYDFDC